MENKEYSFWVGKWCGIWRLLIWRGGEPDSSNTILDAGSPNLDILMSINPFGYAK